MSDLSKQLKNIEKKIQASVNGRVGFNDLFPNSFIQKYSNFDSFEDLFKHSNFQFETQDDFNRIVEADIDSFIKDNTLFSTWEEMKQTAGKTYIQNKLKSL